MYKQVTEEKFVAATALATTVEANVGATYVAFHYVGALLVGIRVHAEDAVGFFLIEGR